MNFLSHFYTANKTISPYELLGVILPDLTKDFSRTYNKEVAEQYFPKQKELIEMKAGVELHIKGDDLFHNHPLFLKHEAFAKTILKEKIALKAKRKYIIAHVIVELLIDQYILNKDEQVVIDFYNRLDLVNLETANTFFEEINISEEASHFKNNFSFFRERKFLNRLKENKGVIFTLDKVFGKLFATDFENQYTLWNEVIDLIKIKLNEDLSILLADLKTKINE
ncbi:MAG: hypothetical protein ACPG4Y_08490 [Chitinophagales bacterium]